MIHAAVFIIVYNYLHSVAALSCLRHLHELDGSPERTNSCLFICFSFFLEHVCGLKVTFPTLIYDYNQNQSLLLITSLPQTHQQNVVLLYSVQAYSVSSNHTHTHSAT